MGNSSLYMLVIYAAAFIGIFYFLLIRPQQRQRRAHEALVSSIKPGDKVVTAGGIFGTVKRTESDAIVLTVAKGVDIRVARRAIGEVVSEGPAAAESEAVKSGTKELDEATADSPGPGSDTDDDA